MYIPIPGVAMTAPATTALPKIASRIPHGKHASTYVGAASAVAHTDSAASARAIIILQYYGYSKIIAKVCAVRNVVTREPNRLREMQ
jgi:hypothetical protein